MRTTLAIDDDVLAAAKAIARDEHRSLGAVISDLARGSLAQPRASGSRNGVPLLRPGGAPVTLAIVNAFARRLRLTFLLDVNVLIALIDPAHVAHEAAHAWFANERQRMWATCPLTENGVIRIIGHPRYPNTPGSPAEAVAIVRTLCGLPGHRFWPDDLSLLDGRAIDPKLILTSAQVTDTYLLALTVAHGGKLATFDRRLSCAVVKGGDSAIHQIQ